MESSTTGNRGQRRVAEVVVDVGGPRPGAGVAAGRGGSPPAGSLSRRRLVLLFLVVVVNGATMWYALADHQEQEQAVLADADAAGLLPPSTAQTAKPLAKPLAKPVAPVAPAATAAAATPQHERRGGRDDGGLVRRLPAPGAAERALWLREPQSPCDWLTGNSYHDGWEYCTPDGHEERSSLGKCMHSSRIRSTMCVGDFVGLDAGKIKVVKGGVPLKRVMGQTEKAEMPVYERGALFGACAISHPPELDKHTYPAHLKELMTSMTHLDTTMDSVCELWLPGTTLVVQRFEYANLYHTLTDWYNTYQAYMMHMLDGKPARLLFLDGHPEGSLDQPWEHMFPEGFQFVVRDDGVKKICMERAVFVAPGYASSMFQFKSRDQCSGSEHVADFARFVVHSALEGQARSVSRFGLPGATTLVSVILRKDYVAHARSKGSVKRQIANGDDVVAMIDKQNGLSARALMLEKMTFAEQVAAMQETDVLVGVHGAGMSHSVFLRPGAAVVEIVPDSFSARPHFKFLSAWSGHPYSTFRVAQSGQGPFRVNAKGLADVVVTASKTVQKGHHYV